jgi:TolA-binding protein
VPSSSDRLLIGSGADGLAPLRMSLLLSSPPQGDEPDGTRQQLRQEQRTLAEIDDRIASQLEVNEKIRRLEEYQLMLKERIVQLDQRKPAPASAAAKQSEAAAHAQRHGQAARNPQEPGHRLWPGWRQCWQAWAH